MNKIDMLYEQGRQMEKNKSINDRKGRGVFYTPVEVVDYMSREALQGIDVVENPYVRILDIACGAGYFLFKAYELLKEMFEEHLEEIKTRHPELRDNLTSESIGSFIVENNIWGVDIDHQAVDFVRVALMGEAGTHCRTNIICTDSLLSEGCDEENNSFWKQEYDIVIGNPPYIGHKAVPARYKSELYRYYKDVYRDKADISYCFFKRGMSLLKQGGILSFITSRYFMEGPSADGLRELLSSFAVKEILDFEDSKVFGSVGVSVCVITVKKDTNEQPILIKKLRDREDKQLDELMKTGLDAFWIDKNFLRNEGWILQPPDKLKLFQLIDAQSTHSLSELFDSYQGIITGCDKAFIVSREQAAELSIEPSLLKPWIKNSHIEKGTIKASYKFIIYTDIIENSEEYPAALRFAEAHMDRLMQRRECQRGVRQWYQLQWGRNIESFETPKIVYPYKASENRFAVDNEGFYCSADVYSLILKEKFRSRFSLEYLTALLNSKLVEFYFKCFAKRISPSLFDYYPNTVLRIKLKLNEENKEISTLAASLAACREHAERECILKAIDREVYKMYGLTEKDIQIIENSAGE